MNALEVCKVEAESKLKDHEEIQSLRENEIEYALTFMENVNRQWSDADFEMK